jgi:hypothetical protein
MTGVLVQGGDGGRSNPKSIGHAARRGNRIVERVRIHDMLIHMKRTTLLLDSALYAELRRVAAAEGRTLTAVVERALRRGLAVDRPRRRRVTLPSYDLGPFLVRPGGEGLPLGEPEAPETGS